MTEMLKLMSQSIADDIMYKLDKFSELHLVNAIRTDKSFFNKYEKFYHKGIKKFRMKQLFKFYIQYLSSNSPFYFVGFLILVVVIFILLIVFFPTVVSWSINTFIVFAFSFTISFLLLSPLIVKSFFMDTYPDFDVVIVLALFYAMVDVFYHYFDEDRDLALEYGLSMTSAIFKEKKEKIIKKVKDMKNNLPISDLLSPLLFLSKEDLSLIEDILNYKEDNIGLIMQMEFEQEMIEF